MKFIVIGLGNFGSSLAMKLAEDGHEVIGVDSDELNVNNYKDKLTHTLKLDSTNDLAISQLPLEDTDGVIIGIGEDSGAAITTAALLKKHDVANCRIVARSTSEIQRTIFEAMGIDEIINPESEYAGNLASRLAIAGNMNTYLLDDRYEIVEFEVPDSFVDKTVEEAGILKKWQVSLITLVRHRSKKNLLGKQKKEKRVAGVVDGATKFEQEDTMIMFGKIKDLEKMMNSFQ